MLRLIRAGIIGILALGCSGPRPAPIEGKLVWHDGTPAVELARGVVVFESVEHKLAGQGTIAADGSFTITTLREGDGAIVGRCTITVFEPAAPGEGPQPPPILPDKYQRSSVSGLAVDVQSGRNVVTLPLEKLPPSPRKPR